MSLGPHNFLGLPPELTDWSTARYAVLPIPYDATVSYQTGSRWGPDAILTASGQVETFDEEYGREFVECGIATLEPLEPHAAGPKEMSTRIAEAAGKVLDAGKILLSLGGEHSVSFGLVQAAKARHPRLSVLQIDAHADLRSSYHGTPFSHACVMRRIDELGVPAVRVGIRNWSVEEDQFIREKKIELFTPRRIRGMPDWIDQAVAGLSDTLYITIDIDGFDPAAAPGTGTPEPGGLDWFQVTDLLKAALRGRRLVGADIVEVMPVPGGRQTEFLAAKLLYKIIAHAEGQTGRK